MKYIAGSSYQNSFDLKNIMSHPSDSETWGYIRLIPEVKRILTDAANLLAQFNFHPVDINGKKIVEPKILEYIAGFKLQNTARMFSWCYNVEAQGVFVAPVWSEYDREIRCYAKHIVVEQNGYYKLDGITNDFSLEENDVLYWACENPDMHNVGWLSASKRLCRKIIQLEKAVISQATSNVPGSIFLTPLEATPKVIGEETDDTMAGESQSRANAFQNILSEIINAAFDEYAEGSQVQAGVMGLQAQFIEYVTKGIIDLSRPIDQYIYIQLEQAIKQLAKTGPLPPEDLLGFGVTNRWNSQEIAKQRLQMYRLPEAQMFVDKVTPFVLEQAVSDGFDMIYGLVPDYTPLLAKPDLTDVLPDAYDKGIISKRSYAVLSGIPEEHILDETINVTSASQTPDINNQFEVLETAFNSVLTETLDEIFLAYAVRVESKAKKLDTEHVVESPDVYYQQAANSETLTEEETVSILVLLEIFMRRSMFVGEFTEKDIAKLKKEIESGKLEKLVGKDKTFAPVKQIVEKVSPIVIASFTEMMRERIVSYLERRKNNPNAIGFTIAGKKSLETFFTQHDIFDVAGEALNGTSFLVNSYMETLNRLRSVGRKKWFYGEILLRKQPYIEHLVLDGQITEGDSIAGYYPGDHRNCKCSFVDIVERV